MTEKQRLDLIFGENKVTYCDHCRVFITICEVCEIASCTGGGCEVCKDEKFLKGKRIRIENYLSAAERKVYDKIQALERVMFSSLNDGESEIDWQKQYSLGRLSQRDEEAFSEELKNIKK